MNYPKDHTCPLQCMLKYKIIIIIIIIKGIYSSIYNEFKFGKNRV